MATFADHCRTAADFELEQIKSVLLVRLSACDDQWVPKRFRIDIAMQRSLDKLALSVVNAEMKLRAITDD